MCYTGLGKKVAPRLSESRLLTPSGCGSRVGTTLFPSPVHVFTAISYLLRGPLSSSPMCLLLGFIVSRLTLICPRTILWSCMNRAARIDYVYVLQIAGKHITYWLINLLRLTNTHEHTIMCLHTNIVCPRRMSWLNILWLLLSISAGSTLKLKKYVTSIKEKDVWPQYIYKTVTFNRKPFVWKLYPNKTLLQ